MGEALAIGVDVGGTFTDFVVAGTGGLRVIKVPSTPADPSEGILHGLAALGIRDWTRFIHGSTIATNALLERQGAQAAFLTTEGFRDLLEIGRQTRLDLYSLAPRKHRPLIPRERCFEVPERVDRFGKILTPLDVEALDAALDAMVMAGAEAVAICFLFSFANPAHERLAGLRARARGLTVSLSSEILPEYREYERASTVAANAYLQPLVARYLSSLADRLRGEETAEERRRTTDVGPRVPERGLRATDGPGADAHDRTSPNRNSPSVAHPSSFVVRRPSSVVSRSPRIMQSNGGIVSLETAAREPVRMVLSGPAGGVVAAWQLARAAGVERAIGFDMGGTSTDVSLIDGEPQLAREATIDHLPIRVPMLDIHAVGAGGGSIARLDRGGALRVGPESAGADPGPAAYGRGNQPTVTDANLALGRFYVPAFLGGRMALDRGRAEDAVRAVAGDLGLELAEAASGIIRVVNTQMARAIRQVSLERGHDPRRDTLVAFGGSGPLHACELAGEVGTPSVLVPRYPGALSALGLLLSDVGKDYSETVMQATTAVSAAQLGRRFRALEGRAREELAAEAIPPEAARLQRSLDMRYQGQSFELSVPATRLSPPQLAARFQERHRRAFGYASATAPTEIVALRVRATGCVPKPALPMGETTREPLPTPLARQPVFFGTWCDCPVLDRALLAPGHRLEGPALLVQEDTTTLVAPGWLARIDAWYNVMLTPDPS